MDQSVIDNDDRALELRRQGQSFAHIAKTLGYEHSRLAHEAFLRALRRRPRPERTAVQAEEQRRLDALAERIRARPQLSKIEIEARLQAIDGLRRVLMEDEPSPRTQ